MGGGDPPGIAPRRKEPARQDTASGTARKRTGSDRAGAYQSRDSARSETVSTQDIKYLPYLLPYVRVLFLIHSITESDDMTGRLVQPLLRRVLEMRRQCARDGWWN